MQKLLMSAAALAVSATGFSAVELDWTRSSNSVQAIIWDALYELKVEDDASPYPLGFVQVTDQGALVVDDGRTRLECSSRSFGMLPVQNYKCTFSGTDLGWTRSSNSVQAVLFDGLTKLKVADDASRWPLGFVKIGEDGTYFVEDASTKLTCDAGSFGMLPVQNYKCELEVK